MFPYLKLKNLNLHNKIYIIIPNIKTENLKLIIKIFNFFNVGFMYLIDGKFFIKGFSTERDFVDGLLIKLILPITDISEFKRIFEKLFTLLKIKRYLILNDMVNGNTLLKSVYSNLDFLTSYNPLKNLNWNKKDKIWMNHKLFTEKFEPIYPDLLKNYSNK